VTRHERLASPLLVVCLSGCAGGEIGPEMDDLTEIGATSEVEWVALHEFGDVDHVAWFPTDGSPAAAPGDAFRLRVLEPGRRSWLDHPAFAHTGGRVADTGERAIRIVRGDHGTAAVYTRFPGVAMDDPVRETGCLGIRFWGVSGASASVAGTARDSFGSGADDLSDVEYHGGFTVIGDRLTVRRPGVGAVDLGVPVVLGAWNVAQFEFRGGNEIAVRAMGSERQWLTVRERGADQAPLRLGLVSAGLNAFDLTADEASVRTIALIRGPCP